MSNAPARRWMATIFDLDWSLAKISGAVTFLRGQEEKCPKTGKIHYQVYFKLNHAVRRDGAKKDLGSPSAHLDRCNGTHEECVAYVTKEESRVVGGKTFAHGKEEEVGQGKRNDVRLAMKAYVNGGINGVMEHAPEYAFSHAKSLLAYHQLAMQQQFRMNTKEIMVIFCHGDPGKGKTSGTFKALGTNVIRLFPQDDGRLWFDGYDPVQHKVLFIDDVPAMGMSRLKTDFWLKSLDRYIDQVQTKGGFTRAAYNMVIIVSNYKYGEVFGDNAAIARRVHIRVHNAFDDCWLLRALVKAQSRFANRWLIKEFYDQWDEGTWKPHEEIEVQADCPKDVCKYPDEGPVQNEEPVEPELDDAGVWESDNEDGDVDQLNALQNAYDNPVQDDDTDDESSVIGGMCEPTQPLESDDEPGFDDDSFEVPVQMTPKRKMPARSQLKRAKARYLDELD